MYKINEGNLDHCLKCSICHTQCPVVFNCLEYPGPKYLGPELERIRLARGDKEPQKVDDSTTYCTNCKRCDIACPHGVKPSFYILKNKAKVKSKPFINLRNWILAHNFWWGKIASIIPDLSNFIFKLSITKFIMGLLGFAPREFPKYSRQTLRVDNVDINIKTNNEQEQKKVLYFPGCYANFNEPEIIQATVEILERHEYIVEIAPMSCCGTPIISNGLFGESKKLVKKNIDVFINYIERGYKIVTTCPSCGLALKNEYVNLVPETKTEQVAQNVWDLFELLEKEEVLHFKKSSSKENDNNKIATAFYHVPCHLIAQGIGYPGVNILRKFAVDNLLLEDRYCCGIAGTYGFKKEKYELSKAVGKPLFEAIKDSDANLIITDCGTCKLQIKQANGIPVTHTVLVLRNYLI
jgi:glycerol-3-phosphate dehydrogenase subunit C